ncbi:MAG: hypothetical protein HKN01_01905, partial [Acidimicrobiia bacterium]|nr:hypothetical protein [Acidimicrobiia bacterium]
SFWSTAPRRRELADLADYLVLMAYDEHNRFRPDGPVASPQWVEDNLRYLLRFADPHEIVIGLNFYGRIWDPDELDKPRAVGLGSLVDLAAGGEATFDPETGLDRVELSDGRHLWLETPEGLRFDLIDEYGLAGWAAWRLGFDSAAIWEAVP